MDISQLFGLLLLLAAYICADAKDPSVEILGGPDLYVHSGSPINLTCLVLNSVEFPKWYHNGVYVINSVAKREIQTEVNLNTSRSSLIKKKADQLDAGKYTCIAANAQQMSTVLHVVNDELNCTGVVCPHGTIPALEGISAVPCPEDSHRPLVSQVNDGETAESINKCCLAPCKCKQTCPSQPTDCPPDSHPKVIMPATGQPGSCCPHYTCGGANSEEHLSEPDPPSNVHAHHMNSASEGCISGHNGVLMANGDEWPEDPCTTCRCENGKKKCHAYMCMSSCINPRYVPGECCPVCDSMSVVTLPPHCPSLAQCSLRCHQGLAKDKDGCFLCQCQAEECKLECPHGFSEDSMGNKLCECADQPSSCPLLTSCKKNCTHGLRTNRLGCPVCKCNKCKQMLFSSSTPNNDGGGMGSLIESPAHGSLLLCPGPCLHGYIKDRGCPTCWCNDPPHSSQEITGVYSEEVTKAASSCISSDGTEKGPDDVWWNGCRKCQCIEGSESCSLANCPPAQQPCDQPKIINGQCCPVCSEPVGWRGVIGVFSLLVLVIIIMGVLLIKQYLWWPWRGCHCLQESDGGVEVLGISPSPSPTDSPGPTPQSNGIKYDIPPLSLSGKGVRRSGEHYEFVPQYDPALGDCEKSTLAPH